VPGKRKRRLIVAIGLVQSIRKASLFFIVRCNNLRHSGH
jgi:hypothetical protein